MTEDNAKEIVKELKRLNDTIGMIWLMILIVGLGTWVLT